MAPRALYIDSQKESPSVVVHPEYFVLIGFVARRKNESIDNIKDQRKMKKKTNENHAQRDICCRFVSTEPISVETEIPGRKCKDRSGR